MRLRLLALVLGLAAAPAAAETLQVTVAGAPIDLVLPGGFCRLERANAIDGAVIANIERAVGDSNHVLVVFAECGQLEAIRSGREQLLHDFGAYMSPARGGVQTMPPANFAQQMTEVYKAQGAEIIKSAEATTRDRINSMNIGLKVGEHKLIGVMRTDERASYVGIIQNLGLPDGSTKVQLAIVAAGLIRQRVISLNLYTPFGAGTQGSASTDRLLALAADVYAGTVAANQQ